VTFACLPVLVMGLFVEGFSSSAAPNAQTEGDDPVIKQMQRVALRVPEPTELVRSFQGPDPSATSIRTKLRLLHGGSRDRRTRGTPLEYPVKSASIAGSSTARPSL
jgi:hypothetical protein